MRALCWPRRSSGQDVCVVPDHLHRVAVPRNGPRHYRPRSWCMRPISKYQHLEPSNEQGGCWDVYPRHCTMFFYHNRQQTGEQVKQADETSRSHGVRKEAKNQIRQLLTPECRARVYAPICRRSPSPSQRLGDVAATARSNRTYGDTVRPTNIHRAPDDAYTPPTAHPKIK